MLRKEPTHILPLKLLKGATVHFLSIWWITLSKHLYKGNMKKQSPRLVLWKVVLRNFAKFTGKHLCQSLLFNKVAGLRPATLLKKRHWHTGVFLWILRFFLKHLFYRKPPVDCLCINIRSLKLHELEKVFRILHYWLNYKNVTFPNFLKKLQVRI